MVLGSWGYPNGQIPTAAMAPVYSRGGTFWLEPSAQMWWNLLAAEYQRVWGVPLDITDAYRSLAEQQYYWDAYQAGWGNVAAKPGKSNHGWAMAVDIYTPAFGGSTSDPRHQWLQVWAPKYGWTWTTGKASMESWHWEFAVAPTAPIPAGESVVDNDSQLEEDENMLYYRDTDTKIIYARDLSVPLGKPALTIIGKVPGDSSTVGYLGAPIGAKIANINGADISKLIDYYGVNPVPAKLYTVFLGNSVPVKGLKSA